MIKEESHIDDFLREELNNLEIFVPQDVWEHIEAHLDKNKKRRTGFIIILTGLAAGLALLIGFSVYRITESPRLNIKQSVQIVNSTKSKQISELKPVNNKILPKNNTSTVQVEMKKQRFQQIIGSQDTIATDHEPKHIKNQDEDHDILLKASVNKVQDNETPSDKNTNVSTSLTSNSLSMPSYALIFG